MRAANRTASLIGAPTDIGASDRGASMGPEALRVAGIHAALSQRGLDVVDCGNVSGPANPGLLKIDGYRNLTQVTAWNHEVHNSVYRELTEQRLPILLGGDHCLSIGSISAVARHCRNKRKSLRVIVPVWIRSPRVASDRRRDAGDICEVGTANWYPQRRYGRETICA